MQKKVESCETACNNIQKVRKKETSLENSSYSLICAEKVESCETACNNIQKVRKKETSLENSSYSLICAEKVESWLNKQ